MNYSFNDYLPLAKMCESSYTWNPWPRGEKDELVEFVEGAAVSYCLRSGDTMYFIVRGTDDLRDWFRNIRFRDRHTNGIHAGWYFTFRKLWPRMEEFYHDHYCKDTCYQVKIGGHSMGGAVATLITRWMIHINEAWVTRAAVFGAPSPFSAERGRRENKLMWANGLKRFVNGNDIVPSLLNWRGNYPVGDEIRIGKYKRRRWYRGIADHNMSRYVESMNEIIF